MQFPVELEIGALTISAHLVCEVAAYALAFRVYLARRKRIGDTLPDETRWLLIAAAAVGAALGSKLCSWLVDPRAFVAAAGDPRWMMQQKTIVGAILGGWLAVELVKRWTRVTTRTGDLFAVPLALGIAFGRVGCFLAGLDDRTHGVATTLPWGVDFGDGVARHPVQLYESAFALGLVFVLRRIESRPHAPGAVFRTFLVAYFAFRVAVDFLKPAPSFAGLATLQWAALAGLMFALLPARAAAPALESR